MDKNNKKRIKRSIKSQTKNIKSCLKILKMQSESTKIFIKIDK